MTDRDKKTIRVGAVLIAIYLASFYGIRMWKSGEKGRRDYQTMVSKARQLQDDLSAQENKSLLFEKLSEAYKLDPRKISKETLVADASAAIQTAAQQSGIGLGPFRESPGRGSSRELTTIQVEGSGPLAGAIGLLNKLQSLGYPLIIDSVQITVAPNQPGRLKVNLTIVILNYDQWKGAGPNA